MYPNLSPQGDQHKREEARDATIGDGRRTNDFLTLEGHALLSDDGTDIRDLVKLVPVALGVTLSRCEVQGIGTGMTEVIESGSFHVRHFIRDPDDAVPCPVCEGARWPDYPLCGGGTVPRRQAKSYLAESC